MLSNVANQYKDEDYLEQCMNVVFPKKIVLKESKRLPPEQAKELLEIKREIFSKPLTKERKIYIINFFLNGQNLLIHQRST